jgi:hypothetical protein
MTAPSPARFCATRLTYLSAAGIKRTSHGLGFNVFRINTGVEFLIGFFGD